MKKLFVIIILVFLLTACLGSAPTQTDVDTLGTVVAGTLTAMPSATSTPEPTATEVVPTFTPEPSYVLPRSLYYLAKDASGNFQIYRLERDGVTVTQISDVDNGVSGFDISSVDGSIAFIAKNRLFISDSNGGNREPIAENSDTETLGFPLWAPDGKTIFYKFGRDLVVYSLDTGESKVLFAGSNNEYSYPLSFSPDGRKLLIKKHRSPSAGETPVFIYDFTSQALIPISWINPIYTQPPYPCFGYITWDTPDSFFCYTHRIVSVNMPGLWYVNANDGSAESLVVSESLKPPFLLVNAPQRYLSGDLYYLYGEDDGFYSQGLPHPYLSLMRSSISNFKDRVIVRPEAFFVNNALWMPDGSALLIIQNDQTNDILTNMILAPIDPSLPIVTILADASKLDPDSLLWGP